LFVAAGLAVILLGERAPGPRRVMLGLIGWFLGASARSVDRWVVMDALIAGVLVEEAMEAEMDTISPQLTLDTFGQQVLDGTLGPALPVLRAGELVGIVGALQLRTVPRRDWPMTRTSEVMVDLAKVPTIGPEESLTDGLERLRTSELDGLPVLVGTDLRGVLTRRSIAVALRTRADLHGMTQPSAPTRRRRIAAALGRGGPGRGARRRPGSHGAGDRLLSEALSAFAEPVISTTAAAPGTTPRWTAT
jgi:CBS domain-containing protein